MPVAANGKERVGGIGSPGEQVMAKTAWNDTPQDNHYVLWSMMFDKDISL